MELSRQEDDSGLEWNGKETAIHFDASIPMEVMRKLLDAVDKK